MLDTSLHTKLLDFLTTLDGAETIDDAWVPTVDFLRDLGAAHVGIHIDQGESETLQWRSPPKWVTDMYRDMIYPHFDLRLKHCRENVTPYFYGKEFWEREPGLSAPRRHFDEEIVSIGSRSAVSFPCNTVADKGRGFFAITADLDAEDFWRLYAQYGLVIQLAGSSAFDCIAFQAQNGKPPSVCLTGRERECLLWLGRGLRFDQIAERLGLSRATVEFHLSNARRKLDARTREQALVRAVQWGLIEP